jgi:hypothetical protein
VREGDHLDDGGVDGKIMLEWILEKRDGVAWTQGRNRWWARVNIIMNLQVP